MVHEILFVFAIVVSALVATAHLAMISSAFGTGRTTQANVWQFVAVALAWIGWAIF
jgi:hypothetical protein